MYIYIEYPCIYDLTIRSVFPGEPNGKQPAEDAAGAGGDISLVLNAGEE